MDVARYAESTGMERNCTYTQAWRYRDYVIRSFNEDKPFDRFIREQVAGDLLPEPTDEQLIATGFHCNAIFDGGVRWPYALPPNLPVSSRLVCGSDGERSGDCVLREREVDAYCPLP